MHPDGEAPSGADTLDHTSGSLLYGMEYHRVGKSQEDAACAVCQLNRWEAVYTQWGRSENCTNGHETLYSGYVMSSPYNTNEGEFVCVDKEQAKHSSSSSHWQQGGWLSPTQMRPGSEDEAQYHSEEVGCSVCAAMLQKDETPFAAQQGNALQGEWVKIRTLHTGQDVTISYGYEAASGTASSTEETKQSSYSRAWDVRHCFSATFEGRSVLTTNNASADTCAGQSSNESEFIAKTTAEETAWDVTTPGWMKDTFFIPDTPPEGTPEASTIRSSGVHLWQWKWTIIEKAEMGNQQKQYEAKANSHFLFSPNDPNDSQPKRPCCFPGQEHGQWYPFNCKSSEGLLQGATSAQHCEVGAPDDTIRRIKSMTTAEIVAWLEDLGLSQDYAQTVTSNGLTGRALAIMARAVRKRDPRAVRLVSDTFDTGDNWGDAYIILAALIRLENKATA